jgi:hypothetical protein
MIRVESLADKVSGTYISKRFEGCLASPSSSRASSSRNTSLRNFVEVCDDVPPLPH